MSGRVLDVCSYEAYHLKDHAYQETEEPVSAANSSCSDLAILPIEELVFLIIA